MNLSLAQTNKKADRLGFTLIEILISFAVFSFVTAGLIYGYVQINRMAEWCSMSLAAQSYASQGLEQAKALQWNSQTASTSTFGPGTDNEFMPPSWSTNYVTTNTMDVPTTGSPFVITDIVYITAITTQRPYVAMIRSDCTWNFPLNGKVCTNTLITYRAPDQ